MADGARRRVTTVVLDRDGVINAKAPEGEYVTDWAQFSFLPGALDALARLADAGLRVIVVTNQRGIARGRMTEQDLAAIHARLTSAVAGAGGRMDAIYHCPHAGGCECRKPAPGMLLRAAAEHRFSLAESAMVGDRAHDMAAAEAVGALRLYIAGFDEPTPAADYVAADLADAVDWLLGSAVVPSPRMLPT